MLFAPAGTAGVLQRAGSRVHFSHPLLRRAVLHRAPPARRRAVHEMLATLLAGAGSHRCPHSSSGPAPPPARRPARRAAGGGGRRPRPHAERAAA
ncbi:hypothetical protein NKH18_11455 [Streptomyces sp. M10(2022)]